MTGRIVYLIRGLPGSGKSHKTRRLAADGGIGLETDSYFYTQVGDDPARSKSTLDGHRVPMATIRHWMQSWRYDLTVDEILRCK